MRGFCQCGCGKPAPIAKMTNSKCGHVKGEPVRYIIGHHRRKSPVDYIIDKNGCWLWQGATNGKGGYGQLRRKGKLIQAHRFYYERDVGPIPDGMDLDHLCRKKLCVNPEHMEPVTRQVNLLRAFEARRRGV